MRAFASQRTTQSKPEQRQRGGPMVPARDDDGDHDSVASSNHCDDDGHDCETGDYRHSLHSRGAWSRGEFEEGSDNAMSVDDRVTVSEEGESAIAQQESTDVFRIKLVVFLVLLVSAIVVAQTLWLYINQSEERQFHKSFTDDAEKIFAAVGANLAQTHDLLTTVATQVTALAAATNQSWPYVTVPSFAQMASQILPLSHAVRLAVLPVVSQSQRYEWERYTAQPSSRAWIAESVHFQNTHWHVNATTTRNGTSTSLHETFLHQFDGASSPMPPDDYVPPTNATSHDVHLPVWQNFPIPTGPVRS
jgi:hypothetical protein